MVRSYNLGIIHSADLAELARVQLPMPAIKALDILRSKGYISLIVGGWVRDAIIGIQARDVDIVTNASLDIVQSIFPSARKVSGRFPHILILLDGMYLEIAEFHSAPCTLPACSVRNSRIKEIEAAVRLDHLSRDFTINALYYCHSTNLVFDACYGYRDVQRKIIRFITAPSQYIRDNPISMLRAIRISRKLDFILEPKASQSIKDYSHLISSAKFDRVIVEFAKHLNSGKSIQCLLEMCNYDLDRIIFPELVALLLPTEKNFVFSSLNLLDIACNRGAYFSIEFFLATLLWPVVQTEIDNFHSSSFEEFSTYFSAHLMSYTNKNNFLIVFLDKILFIWFSQRQLSNPMASPSPEILNDRRISVYLNFLSLREEMGEVDSGISDSWLNILKQK